MESNVEGYQQYSGRAIYVFLLALNELLKIYKLHPRYFVTPLNANVTKKKRKYTVYEQQIEG